MNAEKTFLLILVMGLVTFCIRALPFWAFSGTRRQPAAVVYLGRVLPPAMMAMLIIYCLKNVSLFVMPFGIPEALGIAVVVLLHLWKKNTLLSIGGGTVCYMVLVQIVF